MRLIAKLVTVALMLTAFDAYGQVNIPVVFTSRTAPADGSNYIRDADGDGDSEENGLGGIGAHSRTRSSGPGQLLVREADGSIRVLLDGSQPNAFGIVDVDHPSVSYDGQQIVFAGTTETPSNDRLNGPGTWLIYAINANGSGLRQITTTQAPLTLPSGQTFFQFDDFHPTWLPDGRIVFSSTRWPLFGTYSGLRASNLWVVNSDGSGLHRITSERNAAEQPVVNPATGKIMYSAWWRNHWCPDPEVAYLEGMGGILRRDGVMAGPRQGDATSVLRGLCGGQVWHLREVNPDGTGLHTVARLMNFPAEAHAYGGTFDPDGHIVTTYYPMQNMSEASGFGGIKRVPTGLATSDRNAYQEELVGVGIGQIGNYLFSGGHPFTQPNECCSYGVFASPDGYAAYPERLPDGRYLFSWTLPASPEQVILQDYGLWVMDANGRNRQLLIDVPGRQEIEAQPLIARSLPPVISDDIVAVADPVPPPENGPYGNTYTFRSLNVWFNAPVDTNAVQAPPVRSATEIRGFTAFQRDGRGSFAFEDFPILVGIEPIQPDGSLTMNLPADLPNFEQLRGPNGVPATESFSRGVDGAAHVNGMNFGRPGDTQECVGCHVGHSNIPIPADPSFTNLLPSFTASNSRTNDLRALTDPQTQGPGTYTFNGPYVLAQSVTVYGNGPVSGSVFRGGVEVAAFSGTSAPGGTTFSFGAGAVDQMVLNVGGSITEAELLASADLGGTPPPPPPPPPDPDPAVLVGVSISPSQVETGQSATGTVSLDIPATENTSVALSSSVLEAQVPASVTVLSGASSATFEVLTVPGLEANVTATVLASLNGTEVSDTLLITGIAPPPPDPDPDPEPEPDPGEPVSLRIFTINGCGTGNCMPVTVSTGETVTGRVEINGVAPEGGLTVDVRVPRRGATFTAPASVVIPAGASFVEFSATAPDSPTLTGIQIAIKDLGSWVVMVRVQ